MNYEIRYIKVKPDFVASVGTKNRVIILTTGINPDTIFDLASLTKPIATLRDVLRFGNLKDKFMDIPVLNLITHTSGIPQRLLWMEWINDYRQYIRHVARSAQPRNTGHFEYSCHNYNLLAAYVKQITGLAPLERWRWNREGVLSPTPPPGRPLAPIPGIPPGKPHDGKAQALGKLAGNAGLFGDIFGVSVWAQMVVSGKWYPPEYWYQFTKAIVEEGGKRFSLGWFLYSTGCRSCGENFHHESFGHAGFTGVSVWFHPNRTFQIVLMPGLKAYPEKSNRFRMLQRINTWLKFQLNRGILLT